MAALLLTVGLAGCGPSAAGEEGTLAEGSGEGGRACGSRGMAQCETGEFCLFEVEAQCGRTDRPGHCEVIPTICTREYRPVCGCDGRTYSNHCDAHAGGASVARDGSCAEQAADDTAEAECVRAGCSGELCRGADEEAMASICVHRPEWDCYRDAACERQVSGACGFTESPELTSCLASH